MFWKFVVALRTCTLIRDKCIENILPVYTYEENAIY